VSEAAVRNAPLFFLPGAFPHEGKNEGKARMFPESSEGPSTGGAAPRSGAAKLLLCDVTGQEASNSFEKRFRSRFWTISVVEVCPIWSPFPNNGSWCARIIEAQFEREIPKMWP
jgi:hypothetical protein